MPLHHEFVIVLCGYLLCSCAEDPDIHKQLRGFDVAMVEVSHRYGELYRAGQDGNLKYARYQLEKIELSIELAVLRRPKRAASAQRFLDESLRPFKEHVLVADSADFRNYFVKLTDGCVSCHAAENVGYIPVRLPLHK